MTLLKFKNQSLADEFYCNYNTVPYNSIEDHRCQLAYVAKVIGPRGFHCQKLDLWHVGVVHLSRSFHFLHMLILGGVCQGDGGRLSTHPWLH